MIIELLVNVIIILSTFFSVGMLFNLSKKLGGKISSAINWFIVGIISISAGFVWRLILAAGRIHSSGNNQIFDINVFHHILVLLGMICFIVAAHKLSSLVRND